MCAKHQQRRESRRHLRTIECIEETEGTIDSGAAMLRVPTLCTDVPIRQVSREQARNDAQNSKWSVGSS